MIPFPNKIKIILRNFREENLSYEKADKLSSPVSSSQTTKTIDILTDIELCEP
jgi:hypothetical protein